MNSAAELLLSVVLVVALCGATVVAVLWFRRRPRRMSSPSDPIRSLEVQLARGAISTEQYHRRRADLGADATTGRFYEPGSIESTESGPE